MAGVQTESFPAQDLVGRSVELTYVWDERDVLLYALGVGAGQSDPLRELEVTTENSAGKELHVLPTFGVLVTQDTIGIGTLEADQTMAVHAEQALTLHRPLSVEGTAHVTARVVDVLDKGSGALVATEALATDARTQEPLLSTRSAVFVRGAGGFGGPRGRHGAPAESPARSPDATFPVSTRPDQALLYRLSGDRNPLHSDPDFAAHSGFERPILHGLATYGITGRVLFNELCGADPERFRAIQGRFTAPVLPGEQLVIKVWADGGDSVRFRTETSGGVVVLDRGLLELA
jgi:acyl dehydratase